VSAGSRWTSIVAALESVGTIRIPFGWTAASRIDGFVPADLARYSSHNLSLGAHGRRGSDGLPRLFGSVKSPSRVRGGRTLLVSVWQTERRQQYPHAPSAIYRFSYWACQGFAITVLHARAWSVGGWTPSPRGPEAYRVADPHLRIGVAQIIRRAGFWRWKKPWQALRLPREADWTSCIRGWQHWPRSGTAGTWSGSNTGPHEGRTVNGRS
jgi:hypothetical protein